ncbi:MAG: hypothetical protein N3B10_00215 [Armatimonadetes bacterium]|nr:hypothetical protein [Armatimonadota bacterium]MCX7966893.1 hypothetical protein [Armatimonadota bacterium]MDW8141851.1 hypothetical protein [Armatimonadota bacterium]
MKTVRLGIWLAVFGLVGSFVAQTSQEFSLKVLELRGRVETQLPDGSQRSVRMDEKLPIGSSVRTQERSTAILEWFPYKARVKLAPESEVRLSTTRALSIQRGRIWVGTPPPPIGERRFPLPVQCKQVQIVSSPDAHFSVACKPDGTVTVSVDQGSVFVSVGQNVITVPKARMLIVSQQNFVIGPMPLTKQEQVLWDMGGVR